MKNGKLLFLLVLILCFSVFLVACSGENAPVADTENAGTEQDGGQEEKKHEMLNYFILEPEVDAFDCEPLAKYNGEIVDYDTTHNLVALKTQDLDVYNKVTDTVTVYDLLTGEALLSFDATYPLYVDDEKIDLWVDIEYPVVRAVKKSYSEDSDRPVYEATYHLLKKDAEAFHTTEFYKSDEQLDQTWVEQFGNGLVAVNVGDQLIWIDRDMETVRTVNAIAANGYDVYYFDSEYQGYLYAWDHEVLQIFNRSGLCSGTYTLAHEGFLNVVILDDGNALIQDFELVDIHTACNVIMGKSRYVMKSYVMNCVTGALEEKELDFIVDGLQTAYAQACAVVTMDDERVFMPFKLCEGYDNQAIIYRINNAGEISKTQEYVVLGNDLEIDYVVKNTTAGVDFWEAMPISDKAYVAYVAEAGYYRGYVFDLDGNKLAPSNIELYLTANYAFNEHAIYDLQMNKIYDFCENGYTLADDVSTGASFDETHDKIYLKKHNFETGIDETFVFDFEAKEPVLLEIAEDEYFVLSIGGGYLTYNEKTDNARFYNVAGELKLSVVEMQELPLPMEKVIVAETMLNGKPVIFVLK